MQRLTDPAGTPIGADTQDRFRLERRTALFTAVSLIGLVAYLVVRNHKFADPNLVVVLRFVLALAIGVLGASIPGFLEVEYNGGGIAFRAAGALALFVIAIWGTPKVESLHLTALPPAAIELDRIEQVDLRTRLGPEKTEDERKSAAAVLTVPLSFRSTTQPALTVIIDETTARLAIGERTFNFRWRNFVVMHEDKKGLWLGVETDASPISLAAGSTIHREVLHEPVDNTTWSDVVQALVNSPTDRGIVTLNVKLKDVSIERQCVVDLKRWSAIVREWMKKNEGLPGRITMDCMSEKGA